MAKQSDTQIPLWNGEPFVSLHVVIGTWAIQVSGPLSIVQRETDRFYTTITSMIQASTINSTRQEPMNVN